MNSKCDFSTRKMCPKNSEKKIMEHFSLKRSRMIILKVFDSRMTELWYFLKLPTNQSLKSFHKNLRSPHVLKWTWCGGHLFNHKPLSQHSSLFNSLTFNEVFKCFRTSHRRRSQWPTTSAKTSEGEVYIWRHNRGIYVTSYMAYACLDRKKEEEKEKILPVEKISKKKKYWHITGKDSSLTNWMYMTSNIH